MQTSKDSLPLTRCILLQIVLIFNVIWLTGVLLPLQGKFDITVSLLPLEQFRTVSIYG